MQRPKSGCIQRFPRATAGSGVRSTRSSTGSAILSSVFSTSSSAFAPPPRAAASSPGTFSRPSPWPAPGSRSDIMSIQPTQKPFYVEISRARDWAELVTDNKAVLHEQLEAVTANGHQCWRGSARWSARREGKRRNPSARMDGRSCAATDRPPRTGIRLCPHVTGDAAWTWGSERVAPVWTRAVRLSRAVAVPLTSIRR